MTMFHVQYPVSKTFLTWEELGCLCRALGFPSDLFQAHPPADTDEVCHEEKGLSVKAMQRMFELNLMHKALHRTFNMHTADWNSCVITRALYMLSHRVLNFEDLHNVRVAYMTYEHVDMKGMVIHKHTLLRTLKMCGRTISPLKLMHRIKHMKSELEEKGRIQLYEFFNLILWCDVYMVYRPEDVEAISGKDDGMFRLVDFNRLLSHHDQRIAHKLNQQYLQDEWDFGMERLGSKDMFTEPPVYTEARISEALNDKQNYRQLKTEVGHSQKRVYRSLAGTVRSRPISAPDLDKYREQKEARSHVNTSAHQAYETVQRRLHSAPSKASDQKSSERPNIPEHVRAHTPQVVTPRDFKDIQRKMENLEFDINTLDSRCQLQVKNEMQFYIPAYLDKLAIKKPDIEYVPEPARKPLHWTSKIINNLAYPPSNLKQCHAKRCDARFRGWQKVRSRKGYHVVVTSLTHGKSEHGRMFEKMERSTTAPVRYLHPDYVLRYTPSSEVEVPRRYLVQKNNLLRKAMKDKEAQQAAETAATDGACVWRQEGARSGGEKGGNAHPNMNIHFFHKKYLHGESSAAAADGSSVERSVLPTSVKDGQGQTFPAGLSQASKPLALRESGDEGPCPALLTGGQEVTEWPQDVPVPHMEHSGPKRIGVGHIGTISLLESIQESRDLEEKFIESPGGANVDDDDDDDVFENQSTMSSDEGAQPLSARALLKSRLRRHKLKMSTPQMANKCRKSRSAPCGSGNGSSRGTNTHQISTQLARRSHKKSRSAGSIKDKKSRDTETTNTDGASPTVNNTNVKNDDKEEKMKGKVSVGTPSYTSSSIPPSMTTSPSPEARFKFNAARGSVTSEESDTSVTAANEMSGNNSHLLMTGNDADSSFSEAMTFPSSHGMAEFPESPNSRKVKLELGESSESKNLSELRFGPRIHFDLMDDLDKTSSVSEVSASLHSTMSERKESIKVNYDFRDYLSDSNMPKKTFSKEIRSRLVSRVENAISPDLKVRLMAEDTSVGIPAS